MNKIYNQVQLREFLEPLKLYESYNESGKLVFNGLLNIPLYHGTTTFFKESILDHGLGAFRDVDIFDIKRAITLLEGVDFSENNSLRFVYEGLKFSESQGNSIAEKQNYNNFRSGSLYLTASALFAASHYTSGYGSEFLNSIKRTYDYLMEKNKSYLDLHLPADHQWHKIFSDKYIHHPMIVVVKPLMIPITALRFESGQNHVMEKLKSISQRNPILDPFHYSLQSLKFEVQNALTYELKEKNNKVLIIKL